MPCCTTSFLFPNMQTPVLFKQVRKRGLLQLRITIFYKHVSIHFLLQNVSSIFRFFYAIGWQEPLLELPKGSWELTVSPWGGPVGFSTPDFWFLWVLFGSLGEPFGHKFGLPGVRTYTYKLPGPLFRNCWSLFRHPELQ